MDRWGEYTYPHEEKNVERIECSFVTNRFPVMTKFWWGQMVRWITNAKKKFFVFIGRSIFFSSAVYSENMNIEQKGRKIFSKSIDRSIHQFVEKSVMCNMMYVCHQYTLLQEHIDVCCTAQSTIWPAYSDFWLLDYVLHYNVRIAKEDPSCLVNCFASLFTVCVDCMLVCNQR